MHCVLIVQSNSKADISHLTNQRHARCERRFVTGILLLSVSAVVSSGQMTLYSNDFTHRINCSFIRERTEGRTSTWTETHTQTLNTMDRGSHTPYSHGLAASVFLPVTFSWVISSFPLVQNGHHLLLSLIFSITWLSVKI